jgi:hypothetical protein
VTTRRLGPRQVDFLFKVQRHGAAIEIVKTKADERMFRRLEELGLVRWARSTSGGGLHGIPLDATYLTDAGRRAIGLKPIAR